jgi:4-hydroxybenzoate polyprenyltransferase/phosphoserine phosphatase
MVLLSSAVATGDPVPLAVDLDGTLLRTNSLIESLAVLARKDPLSLIRLPRWLLQGRASFKKRVSESVLPDVHTLPYRDGVVSFLRAQKRAGRTLILATAADEAIAQAVAGDLGLFDRVFGSDGVTNLKGERKRDQLVDVVGNRGFDYLGNGASDYPVWCAARRALFATASPGLARRVAKSTPVQVITDERRPRWQDYLRMLRPLHWCKNGLVFVPIAAVHRIFEVRLLGRTLLAFLAFSLCASGLYLLNDLLDLPADRSHPSKRNRVLASGRVPLAHALVMLPLLLAAGFGIAANLSIGVATLLGVYCVLMMGYSLKLKDIALVDVFVLAIGYSLRIAVGSVATGVTISAWLLSFCIFLFFSLALIKRYAELIVLESEVEAKLVHARGYHDVDKLILAAQGVASGYLAAMVLALYTNTEISHRLYARHDLFWGVCLLLMYWVSYMWLMVNRGRIHDDPVIFALSDRGSLCAIGAMGLLVALAS